MKKIINGKMYNTETAKKIASYISYKDKYGAIIAEYLYKKTNGEYFLYDLDNTIASYRKLPGIFIPYSVEKAKKWLEENASADIYIQEFGEVEE